MIYYTKEQKKQRMEWKGKNYTFTFSPDLSNGVTLVTNTGMYKGLENPDEIAKDVMSFSFYWFENHFPLLEKFEGFDNVEFCVIPF